MHTGGDLSQLAQVRAAIEPKPLPVYGQIAASDASTLSDPTTRS